MTVREGWREIRIGLYWGGANTHIVRRVQSMLEICLRAWSGYVYFRELLELMIWLAVIVYIWDDLQGMYTAWTRAMKYR